ncbi:MAG: LysR family transcriptional regulator [Clostridia bacterium]|nr:LysR family transcriptional regulator [Clostridia bacterium]
MNEHQIACFLAVRKNLNFSLAAKQLYITQPALSYQIKSLEHDLDVKLFERTTTSVQLTEAGLAFAAPAEKLYSQYLEAVNAVRSYSGKKNRIVLACPRVMIMRDKIYRTLIARIIETFPKYEVEVRINNKGIDPWVGLSSGIDCAIGMKPDTEYPGLEYCLLFQTNCYVVVGPQHSLAGQKNIVPSALNGQTLYYEESDRDYVKILQLIIERSGAAVSLKEVPSYDAVYSNLVAGKGFFVSPMIYEDFPKEWYIHMQTDDLPQTVLMYMKEPNRPFVRILAQLIQQIYKENELLMGSPGTQSAPTTTTGR